MGCCRKGRAKRKKDLVPVTHTYYREGEERGEWERPLPRTARLRARGEGQFQRHFGKKGGGKYTQSVASKRKKRAETWGATMG